MFTFFFSIPRFSDHSHSQETSNQSHESYYSTVSAKEPAADELVEEEAEVVGEAGAVDARPFCWVNSTALALPSREIRSWLR